MDRGRGVLHAGQGGWTGVGVSFMQGRGRSRGWTGVGVSFMQGRGDGQG